jgi:23S rRNA pseudouridine1911/1915/1917 synthase
LSETGHPIVGDELYGGARRRMPASLAALSGIERPFLHAARLTLSHPRTGRRMTFEAALADDFQSALDKIRR